MPQLVITAMGADKPGLVGELTGHLHAAGANILDSRMVNLRGQFAMVVLIEATDPQIAMLSTSVPEVAQRMGLAALLSNLQTIKPAVTGLPFKLKTYSLDQPGLVHKMTDVLRAHGVNIEELSAKQESAAFAGTTLFVMEMRLTVPPAVPVRTLRSELEKQAAALNCDMDLEPG